MMYRIEKRGKKFRSMVLNDDKISGVMLNSDEDPKVLFHIVVRSMNSNDHVELDEAAAYLICHRDIPIR